MDDYSHKGYRMSDEGIDAFTLKKIKNFPDPEWQALKALENGNKNLLLKLMPKLTTLDQNTIKGIMVKNEQDPSKTMWEYFKDFLREDRNEREDIAGFQGLSSLYQKIKTGEKMNYKKAILKLALDKKKTFPDLVDSLPGAWDESKFGEDLTHDMYGAPNPQGRSITKKPLRPDGYLDDGYDAPKFHDKKDLSPIGYQEEEDLLHEIDEEAASITGEPTPLKRFHNDDIQGLSKQQYINTIIQMAKKKKKKIVVKKKKK